MGVRSRRSRVFGQYLYINREANVVAVLWGSVTCP